MALLWSSRVKDNWDCFALFYFNLFTFSCVVFYLVLYLLLHFLSGSFSNRTYFKRLSKHRVWSLCDRATRFPPAESPHKSYIHVHILYIVGPNHTFSAPWKHAIVERNSNSTFVIGVRSPHPESTTKSWTLKLILYIISNVISGMLVSCGRQSL